MSSRPPSTAAPAASFPVHIDPSHRYLVDAGGRPFLIVGDAAWSLVAQLRKEDVAAYLDDRQARGFNTILVNVLEHEFAAAPPKNAYGDGPFTTPGDYSTPNDAYFEYLDWVIQQAQDRGMLVLLDPSYLGYQGGDQGWYQEMVANGPDKLRKYGEFLGARYKRFTNITWVNGGDFNPPDKAVVDAVAQGIAETDPDALQTAHAQPETSALEYWSDYSWLDLDTVYSYQDVYARSIDEYEKAKMPNFLIEGIYENEHGSTPQFVRSQAYHSVLAGSAGEVFGNNPIWAFGAPQANSVGQAESVDTTWQKALDSAGSQSMSHLASLFGGLPWWTLVPDTKGAFLTHGAGTGQDRVVAAVSADRTLAVVYFPESRQVTLDLGQLAGTTAHLSWFDPTSGTTVPAATVPRAGAGPQTVKPTATNAGGGTDWVLVAQSS